jgi:hypothetical protein
MTVTLPAKVRNSFLVLPRDIAISGLVPDVTRCHQTDADATDGSNRFEGKLQLRCLLLFLAPFALPILTFPVNPIGHVVGEDENATARPSNILEM